MDPNQKISEHDSIAFDLIKAVAIFCVIVAHSVSVTDFSIYACYVSLLWKIFAHIGVVIFFIVGGFFYSRKKGDLKPFWKKKLFRLVIPWLFCATLTYLIRAVAHGASLLDYFKWVFGSWSVYYYIVVYLLFLIIFKLFWQRDLWLYLFMALQVTLLILQVFGISTTIPLPFFTDYLNPLHWIGYFSLGILIRRYRLDTVLKKSKTLPVIAAVCVAASLSVAVALRLHTYFHIVTLVYALSSAALIAKVCFMLSRCNAAKQIRKIGAASYCIYLLHLQVVNIILNLFPLNDFTLTVIPLICMAVMIVLVTVGSLVCDKIPHGKKIKALVGLS